MAKKPGTTRKKSAMKQARQSEILRLRNQHVKSTIKTAAKKVDQALDATNATDTQESLRQAIKVISMAASKGVIHKNTAARRVSRLTKRVNKAMAAPAT